MSNRINGRLDSWRPSRENEWRYSPKRRAGDERSGPMGHVETLVMGMFEREQRFPVRAFGGCTGRRCERC